MKILAINLPNLDLSYFKKRGLDFEVKHINLDLNVPLKFLYNFNGQDFYSPDLHNTLNFKFPKFEQSFILYGYTSNDPKNSTGGYAYFDKLNSGSRWASVRIDGNENKYAVHELHHLICNVINIDFKDITPKDFMDRTPVGNPPIWLNYYLNHDPENPESNHGRTWANIIPFLPKLNNITYTPPIPVVTLKRAYSDDKQQLGDLSIDGFKCKTLELKYRDNQKNISSIPKGIYTCKRRFSIKFGWVYEVQNVKGRSGILIHSGNTFFDIQGCILLGDSFGDINKDKHADILNSTKTVKAFETFMQKKDFILEII